MHWFLIENETLTTRNVLLFLAFLKPHKALGLL